MSFLTDSSTQTNKPWGPTQPLLKNIYADANRLYQQGPNPYTASMVTPYANQSVSAFNGMMNLANANSGNKGMGDNLANIMDQGGYTNRQLDSMNQMRDLMNNGGLTALANGNGFTPGQQRTIDDLRQSTNSSNNMLQNLMQQGGLSASQNTAMNSLQGLLKNNPFDNLMSGNGLTGMQQTQYDQMANSTGQANSMLQSLANAGGLTADQQAVNARNRDIMNSKFDLNSNPYFQQVQDNMLKASAQGVNGQAAANGRYAGAANQNILSRNQGDIAAQMGSNEYNDWKNRTDAAASNLFSGAQTGVTNQGNALSQIGANNTNMFNASGTGLANQMNASNQLQSLQNNLFGMGQQSVTNRMNLANQINQADTNLLNAQQLGVDNRNNAVNSLSGLAGNYFNAGNAGLANMATAYQTALQPYQTERAVGAAYEDLDQRTRQDAHRINQESDPYNWMQKMLTLGSGAPTTQTTTTDPSTLSTLASIFGLGSSATGLLNKIF